MSGPTGNSRRVSIATLGAVVAVAAVDLAWWRHLSAFPRYHPESVLGLWWASFDAGAMPMASLLAVGLVHALSNRGRVSRRLVGALSGGLVGLALFLAYGWTCRLLPPPTVFASMRPIYEFKERLPLRVGWHPSYPLLAHMVYYGTPQLIPALVGGLCLRERPAPADEGDGSRSSSKGNR